MAASVFVSDVRVLNVSIGVAELRLANFVQGDWLSGAPQVAYQDGIDHLVRAGPFGDLPGASRLVRVQFVYPVYRDGAMTLGVRWEAVGVTGGLFSVLDASIRLSGEGGQSSRAVLTASYRPPLGAGAGLDRLLLHRVAAATIKTFYDQRGRRLGGYPRGSRRGGRLVLVGPRTGTGPWLKHGHH
jgi:hypothetical protein